MHQGNDFLYILRRGAPKLHIETERTERRKVFCSFLKKAWTVLQWERILDYKNYSGEEVKYMTKSCPSCDEQVDATAAACPSCSEPLSPSPEEAGMEGPEEDEDTTSPM